MRRLLGTSLVFIGLLTASVAFAQSNDTAATSSSPLSKISFPIAELGNCSSRDACKTYCDDSSHTDACLSFAQSHGLMSKDEASTAKELSTAVGPGGCTGSQCKTYCADSSHQEECVSFAEAHHLKRSPQVSGQAMEHATTTALFKSGMTGPGGCTSADTCKAYCSDSSHITECLSFALKHGLMNKDEVGKAQQFATTTGPGGCKGEECKSYCGDSSHHDECVAFAQEHGLLKNDNGDGERIGSSSNRAFMSRMMVGSSTERRGERGRFGSSTILMHGESWTRTGSSTGEFRMQKEEQGGGMRPQGGMRPEGRGDGVPPQGGMMQQGGVNQPQQGVNQQGDVPSSDGAPQPSQNEIQQDQQALDNGQGSANWTVYPAAVLKAIQGLLH